MIRPLRQRHHAIVCALGVVLPVAFVAGIAARRPVPVATSLPSTLAVHAADFGKIVWTKADVFSNQRIITSLRRNAIGSLAVEFLFRDLVKPDVLVYWSPGKENSGDSLPDSARLLGALANRVPLNIPNNVRGEAGQFVLYSLADHQIVAVSKPFTVQRSNDSMF